MYSVRVQCYSTPKSVRVRNVHKWSCYGGGYTEPSGPRSTSTTDEQQVEPSAITLAVRGTTTEKIASQLSVKGPTYSLVHENFQSQKVSESSKLSATVDTWAPAI